jgi:hypothetical protein
MTNHQLYNNGLIWYDDTKQDRNLVMGRCEARAEGSRLTTILLARALHHTQAINYLEAYGLDIGLLINFGSRSLQFKRVMKPGRRLS